MLIEGVHALKHAVRFGARLRLVATGDPEALEELLADLAPDVPAALPGEPVRLPPGTWEAVGGAGLPSPALAVADRPPDGTAAALAAPGRVLLLEEPTHLGNLGAAVRVAAAATLGGVLTVGSADPWHPRAVRGAAGLQFAVPVGRVARLPATDRPVVAVDPGGVPLPDTRLPERALLAFGTERRGLSGALRERADATVAIPMRAGVSSLNLATAVAVMAYAPGHRA